MKKLFVILILILSMFLLAGCVSAQEKEELLLARANARELVLDIIDRFGAVEDEDLEYDHDNDEEYILGETKIVLGDSVSSVNMLFYQENTTVMLEFIFDDEATRSSMSIWNVMLSYTDMTNEIYISLDYYHYGDLLQSDYRPELFEIGWKDLADQLYLLTLEDIRLILVELGYDEVTEQEETIRV